MQSKVSPVNGQYVGGEWIKSSDTARVGVNTVNGRAPTELHVFIADKF